jgi:drug/metabolite transporter (DMT)-like permease
LALSWLAACWWAIVLVTTASVLLSWNTNGEWGISLGAVGIVAACALWGLDNNLTRNVSAKDPFVIVIVKGFGAGAFSLTLALILRHPFPSLTAALGAMLLGSMSYGLSIVLFVYAMRSLGTARTSALYGVAPFIGAALSLVLFRELPNVLSLVSLPFMVVGAALLVGEDHAHHHIHAAVEHEHNHGHDDEHHIHEHAVNAAPSLRSHSHLHRHDPFRHEHPHMPDLHHRHAHSEELGSAA